MDVFYVNRSEIEDRFDPSFYKDKPDFSKYIKLSKIASVKGGKRIPLGKTYSDMPTDYLYLRVADMLDGRVDYNSLKSIDADVYSMLRSYEIFDGDIALSIAGTIGKVLCVKNIPSSKNVILTENCAKIQVKQNVVLPEYVSLLLTLDSTQKQIELNYIQTTIPKLGLDRIRNLYVPQIPTLSKQQEIVSFYNQMKARNHQKLQEAKEKYASIDDYLLNELGIEFSPKKTSLANRIFSVKFSELCGSRLDCSYTFKISELEKRLSNLNCEVLGNLILKNPQYGANEEALDFADGDIRYIRITDIDDFGNLKDSEKKTAKTIEDKYLLHENDILFARSGSVGRCYIHKKTSQPAIFAGYLIRFVLNEKLVNSDYLFYYCNSSIYKYWVESIQRPAVQANINSTEYKSLKIPLPPLSKQQEIAEHIQRIRAQAKQLQAEAEQILTDAKAQVEKMILGE